MFKNRITYPNGKKEVIGDIIKRNIGMPRRNRKSAANVLGLKFDEYQQAEKLLMTEQKLYPTRLADKKRRIGK
jgi:hypothetical protein